MISKPHPASYSNLSHYFAALAKYERQMNKLFPGVDIDAVHYKFGAVKKRKPA